MSFSVFACPCIAEDSGLTIYFLDVGQADAAVVICDDEVLMIDGGNVADSSFVYSYLTNTLDLEYIDYMIGTHAHEDHIGGLSAALNACSVGTVYSSVTDYDSDAFRDFRRYAEDRGAALLIPEVGDTFDVGDAEVAFLRQYVTMTTSTISLSLFASNMETPPSSLQVMPNGIRNTI